MTIHLVKRSEETGFSLNNSNFIIIHIKNIEELNITEI